MNPPPTPPITEPVDLVQLVSRMDAKLHQHIAMVKRLDNLLKDGHRVDMNFFAAEGDFKQILFLPGNQPANVPAGLPLLTDNVALLRSILDLMIRHYASQRRKVAIWLADHLPDQNVVALSNLNSDPISLFNNGQPNRPVDRRGVPATPSAESQSPPEESGSQVAQPAGHFVTDEIWTGTLGEGKPTRVYNRDHLSG